MKIELAENQKEITLAQYQELVKLEQRDDLNNWEINKRKVKLFTGLNYQQVSAMSQNDLIDTIHTIDKALNQEAVFEPTFEMSGVEFGFLPNFDDMKAKEYFDLSTYNTEPETLHKLMAILFRPIKHKIKSEYEIVNYQGTQEWSDVMRQMPLNIVNGALVFFSNLASELENYTLRFTAEEVASQMQQSISRSGGGMQRFIKWLRGSRGSLNTSKT